MFLDDMPPKMFSDKMGVGAAKHRDGRDAQQQEKTVFDPPVDPTSLMYMASTRMRMRMPRLFGRVPQWPIQQQSYNIPKQDAYQHPPDPKYRAMRDGTGILPLTMSVAMRMPAFRPQVFLMGLQMFVRTGFPLPHGRYAVGQQP